MIKYRKFISAKIQMGRFLNALSLQVLAMTVAKKTNVKLIKKVSTFLKNLTGSETMDMPAHTKFCSSCQDQPSIVFPGGGVFFWWQVCHSYVQTNHGIAFWLTRIAFFFVGWSSESTARNTQPRQLCIKGSVSWSGDRCISRLQSGHGLRS